MGKSKVYVATTEQIWAIHDAVPDHLRVAVLLGAFAGLRIAEVCRLQVTDVDFIRGVGLPVAFSFHDLRHYLASLLIASGADIKTVQARMRHASATTTLDTYGHL